MISFFHKNNLIEKAKKSPEAFDELYRKYMPRTYMFISARTNDIQEAEDITSEIWIKILNKINDFNSEHEYSFDAWIFSITRNHLTDYYRKKSRINEYKTLKEIDNIAQDNNIDKDVDNKILRNKFDKIIQNLPPQQAETVKLKYFGDLKNKEIAIIQEISEKTVASNLTRALEKIKKEMPEQ